MSDYNSECSCLYVTNSYSWQSATKSVRKNGNAIDHASEMFQDSCAHFCTKGLDLKHWSPPLHWCLSAAHRCAEEQFITWELWHKGCPSPFPITYNGRKSFYSLLTPWGLEMALAKRWQLGVPVAQCYVLWSGFLELLHFIFGSRCSLTKNNLQTWGFYQCDFLIYLLKRRESVLHGVRIYECKVFWRPRGVVNGVTL